MAAPVEGAHLAPRALPGAPDPTAPTPQPHGSLRPTPGELSCPPKGGLPHQQQASASTKCNLDGTPQPHRARIQRDTPAPQTGPGGTPQATSRPAFCLAAGAGVSAPAWLNSCDTPANAARGPPLTVPPQAVLTPGMSSSARLGDSRSLGATSLPVLLRPQPHFCPSFWGTSPTAITMASRTSSFCKGAHVGSEPCLL